MYGHDPKVIQQLFLAQLKKEVPNWLKRHQIINYFLKNPNKRWHKFHIVSPSPWPFYLSMALLSLILHFISLLYRDFTAVFCFFFSLFLLITIISLWFRDIIRESTYMGYHTLDVQMMHRTGFVLFLVSEVMVFFGFFWAYFHFALSPSIFGGNIWPPEGIVFFFISENLNDGLQLWYLLGSVHPRNFDFTPGLLETIFLTHNNEESILCLDIFLYIYLGLFFNNVLYDYFSYFSYVDLIFGFSSEFGDSVINKNPPFILEINFNAGGVDWLKSLSCDQFLDILRSLALMGTECKQLYFKNIFNKNIFFNFYSINSFSFSKISFVRYLNLFSSGALINPFRIPLLNTVVLLTSGCILMWGHTCLRLRDYLSSAVGLLITLIFALYFILCQVFEYIHAAFSINDGVYGSIFYMLTGLHGFHVIVGTLFLAVCLARFLQNHFTSTNHFGLEAAIWYWHFVDVVWIFLYIFVYLWPNIYYFSPSTGTVSIVTPPIEMISIFKEPCYFIVYNDDYEYLNESWEVFLNINYKDIKNNVPKFDYDQNINNNINLKLLLISKSIDFFITSCEGILDLCGFERNAIGENKNNNENEKNI